MMRFIPIFAAALVMLFWHSNTRITVAVADSSAREDRSSVSLCEPAHSRAPATRKS